MFVGIDMILTRPTLLEINTEHVKWLADSSKGQRADFSDMDLSWTDFSNFDFSYSNFTNCKLTGATFFYSDISGCYFTTEQLLSAYFGRCRIYKTAGGRYIELTTDAPDSQDMDGLLLLCNRLFNPQLNVDNWLQFWGEF